MKSTKVQTLGAVHADWRSCHIIKMSAAIIIIVVGLHSMLQQPAQMIQHCWFNTHSLVSVFHAVDSVHICMCTPYPG